MKSERHMDTETDSETETETIVHQQRQKKAEVGRARDQRVS